MIFDFSGYRLRNGGYSETPMTILDPEPRALLSAITEIALIETGNRSAREHWQQIQLRNLVNHVTATLGLLAIADWQQESFRYRSRLAADTHAAGLAHTGRLGRPAAAGGGWAFDQASHNTSGSSGVPVQFFCFQIQWQLQC